MMTEPTIERAPMRITFANTEYWRKIVCQLISLHGGSQMETLYTISYVPPKETALDDEQLKVLAAIARRSVETP